MSSENSPRSESRYQRAAETVLPKPNGTATEERRAEQRHREATRRQADEDRKTRGKSREVDEISALFSDGGEPKKPGKVPPHDDQAKDAGREQDTPPKPTRPALELDEDERDADEDQPKRKPKSTSLSEFAEAHQLKEKDIFDVTVPLEAGQEPVTIGALKDHFKETRDFEEKRDRFEDWHDTVQNEILTYRQQIEDVLQRVTSVVPPETLARAFADMQHDGEAQLEKARGQLREWFPEWADVQVKVKDRERLEQVLSTYGFTKFEVGAVRDARLIKFAMDAIRKNDRYDRLKEQGKRDKQPTKEPASQRKPRQPNATDQARSIAEKGDKIGAVAKLLGG